MKIYVIIKEEMGVSEHEIEISTPIKAFTSEDSANKYADKANRVFDKCLTYYSNAELSYYFEGIGEMPQRDPEDFSFTFYIKTIELI
jgi:hypothetical protein